MLSIIPSIAQIHQPTCAHNKKADKFPFGIMNCSGYKSIQVYEDCLQHKLKENMVSNLSNKVGVDVLDINKRMY